MNGAKKIFWWLTPELAVHAAVLIATAATAFCMLKASADLAAMDLAALKLRVSALETQANQTSLLVAQNNVRLDEEARVTEQMRLTTESVRAVLADLSGDLKAVQVLLKNGRRDSQ